MHYLKLFLMNKEIYLKVVCVYSNVYCIITSSHVLLHNASFVKQRITTTVFCLKSLHAMSCRPNTHDKHNLQI